MDPNTFKLLSLVIPGLMAFVGIIVCYYMLKSKLDRSVEMHKIIYAGIYKEKIEIYKEIIKQLYELKLKFQQYQYSGNQQSGELLYTDFNGFIHFYTVNRAFIKLNILNGLDALTNEFQGCFGDLYVYNPLSGTEEIDPKIRMETMKKFFESGNKFNINEPFKVVEDLLVSELKKDLKIEE